MTAAPDFDLLEQIHASARSQVWRARGRDGASLIVKQPNQEFPSFQDLARFRREFAIARRCSDAGVVRPLALFEMDGRWTITFEDIGAVSLDRLLRQRPLASAEFFSLALQLCDAVAAVHAHGVVHKDINPANIVWNAHTGTLQLIDFGIASELPQEAQAPMHPLALEGTLAYMAPEQTGRMNRLLDYRADLYALGATLYAALAGQAPFADATDAMALIHAHIAREPDWDLPALQSLAPGLLAIIQRLMAKDAARRYQSVAVLRADLAGCAMAPLAGPARTHAAERPARLVLPQALYGREAQVRTLLDAFDAVAARSETPGQGGATLVLVAGFSGIGKSAVINEVHKPILARRGLFLAGKFDQFRRDVPYASLLEALRTLVRQLLGEPEAQLARHRARLHAALGDGIGVMLELLPELALVVGAGRGQAIDAAGLAPEQIQAVLARVLPRFIDVFAAPGQPLVLFLDDLQWADAATLGMIELLVRRSDGGPLLVLGAYRDNETAPAHPLLAMRERLQRQGLPVTTIALGPLTQAQVADLLADALGTDTDRCAPLAALCHHKTAGNPFFLRQFLQAMAEQGHLFHDAGSDAWRWDLGAIAAALTTDNVGQLLSARIGRLPAPARSLLQLGAAIGSRFELHTLAVVAGLTPAQAQAALWPALQEGLLQPLDGRYKYVDDSDDSDDGAALSASFGAGAGVGVSYRFLHDRVQHAAYLQSEAPERAARHLDIGRLMLAHASPAEREARLFAIVEQLNAGRALMGDGDERLELARLNSLAAGKARRSAAFAAALAHYDIGLSLLPDRWQPLPEHHGLWFDMALGAAEAAYLCGDTAQAEALYPRVRAHCKDRLEHVRCIAVQAHQYQLQGRLHEAIAIQREGLALLGLAIPESADLLTASAERQYAQLMSMACTIEADAIGALAAADDMRDPADVAAMHLMQGLWMAGYYAGQQALCMMIIMSMTRLSVERGNSDFTAVGYVGFAMMQVVKSADPHQAYRFGAMADRLARSRANLQTRTLTALMFGAACSHWTRPLRDSDRLYDEALAWALAIGDFVQVGVVAAVRATDRVALGDYLPDLLETTLNDIALMRQHGQHAMADCCVAAAVQPVRQLLGQHEDAAIEPFSEAGFMARHGQSALYQAYYLQGQIRVAYLLDRPDAQALALQLDVVTRLMRGQAKVHETTFYAALIWLRALRREADGAAREAMTARLAPLLEQLACWTVHTSHSLACRLALVRAEQARNAGDMAGAVEGYRQASEQAGIDGFINIQALANELAAQFWFDQGRGQHKVAAVFLREAIARYRQWGAQAKVEALLGVVPAAAGRRDGTAPGQDGAFPTTLARASGNSALDLASLLKAAQALGNEVGLAAVLACLMKIVLENSGAQVARLVLRQDDGWRVEADLDEAGAKADVLMGRAVDLDAATAPGLPLSVLRYVLRSGAAVIEDQVADAPLFRRDPHVMAAGAQSIMCLPIRQAGRIDGLLYLENRLLAACFTPEREEFLRMLGAQAMISIAHARLHDGLEARVAERTAQLEEANRQLATLSVTDGLTGVSNRRHFDDVLRHEWARCQRAATSIGVIMIDIDHFKKFNDHFGHQAGDACLAQVASSLQQALRRPGDLLARYGGEEFCVVLPDADSLHAQQTGEHLRCAIADLKLPHAPGAGACISISVGVAVARPSPLSAADVLLRAADGALYQAKSAGRDRVVLAPAAAVETGMPARSTGTEGTDACEASPC